MSSLEGLMERYPKAKNAKTIPSAVRCYGNVAALDASLKLNLVYGVPGMIPPSPFFLLAALRPFS